MNGDEFKWPDGQPMPGDETATVRVVIDSALIGGYRYCFTHFPADVEFQHVLQFTRDQRLLINVTHPGTTIDVETRDRLVGLHEPEHFTPWALHKRLHFMSELIEQQRNHAKPIDPHQPAKEVFWSYAMQRDPLVSALFLEYKLSQRGTFEEFLMSVCVELWKDRTKLMAEAIKGKQS